MTHIVSTSQKSVGPMVAANIKLTDVLSRDRKEVKHHREHQGMIKANVGLPWCTCRF